MSSQKSNKNMKVISLKKMSDIQQDTKVCHKTDLEEHSVKLKKEITDLEKTLQNLQSKKSKLLADMKLTIEKEKNIWLETKEQERAEAKNIGYKVGFDEGIEEAEKIWADKITKVNQSVELAKQDYYQTIEKHESAILRIAFATAEKVIKDKVTDNESMYLNVIGHAIQELKDKSSLSIYVHPSQYDALIEQKAELEQLMEQGDLLSIYMDSKLKEHGCVIKHPYGQVEVGLDVQLQQIKNKLAEILAEES